MKIKHLLIVSLILAVLTIGAVSASEDISDDLTASDITENPINEIPDDIIEDDGNDEPLELQESDFDVNITEKINLDDENVDESDVVSIYCPEESEGGNIKIVHGKYNYTFYYGIDSEIAGSVFTVKASEFHFTRDYPISVYYTNASDELLLKSTTINVTKTLTADEFIIDTNGKYLASYAVAVYYCPLPGTLTVDVDGIERFSKQVVEGYYSSYVYYNDLNITGAGNYNINVKFKPDGGNELVITEFKASLLEFNVFNSFSTKLNSDLFSIDSIVANGTVLIYVDDIQSYSRNVTVGDGTFNVNSKDLNITTSGKYNIQFKFKYANGDEKEVYSKTINVILFEYYYSNHLYLGELYEIFSLYGFAVNGTVEVYVDGVRSYNKCVNSGQNLFIYPNDLNITDAGDCNITLKFISDNETIIYNVTVKMEMFRFDYSRDTLLSSSIFEAYSFPFDGNLTIYVDGIQRYSKEVYKYDCLYVHCNDLNITAPGKYTILVKYKPENGEENEITCYNTTLRMAYISYKSASSLNVTDILLYAYSFVSDGNLIIDVDDVQRYSKEVKANGHISIKVSDLNINTCDIFKIVVKFITEDGEESILDTYYLTTYFEDDMIHIQPSDIPIGKKMALVDFNTKSEDYLNGTVTISIDGQLIYSKTIKDSDNLTRLMVYTDELDLSNLKYDEYKVSAIFMKNGVEKHVSEKFVTFIPNVVIYYPEYFVFGEKEAIYIYAPKGLNGNAVLYEEIYYDYGADSDYNMIDNVTIVDGFARIPLDNLSGGYHDLFLIYKLANLDGSDSFHKIKVINNTPGYSSTISAKEITVGESVLVTLSGNASFKNADIFVDGIKQFSFPFNLGEMMYSVENLTVGDHYITVKYADDSKDIKYSQTYLVTVKNKEVSPVIIKPVKKDTVKLTLKKVKVKKSAKKLVISATLKINGKVAKNKKVTFKFNGKKYTARTDKKGVAKLTVKKNVLKKLKAGKKVDYQVTYDKVTKKISVKVKK